MSIRTQRVADLLKREISYIIQREVKDPRIGFVTITRVKVTDDLKLANVYFSILPSENSVQKSIEGLNRAKEFIRAELKPRLRLRYLPYLKFFVDDTLDYVEKIEKLIAKTKDEEEGK